MLFEIHTDYFENSKQCKKEGNRESVLNSKHGNKNKFGIVILQSIV